MRVSAAPPDPYEAEDLDVLACMLTCAFHLARRLHNAGVLLDLAPIQIARDHVENARIERRPVLDPLDVLLPK